MKIQCPQCGHTQDSPAQFCARCGVQFVVQPIKVSNNGGLRIIIGVVLLLVIADIANSIKESSTVQNTTQSTLTSNKTTGISNSNKEQLKPIFNVEDLAGKRSAEVDKVLGKRSKILTRSGARRGFPSGVIWICEPR